MNESTSKILTVIVPTYNMERYLTQCLESITSIENVGDIDIVVVNDGSTDRSSEIAHGFAARFSNSVSVIDKPNGHYGSCVNVGLAAAKGKFVKVVDADDWVESANFQKLVAELRVCDADLVVCRYVDCFDDGKGVQSVGAARFPQERVAVSDIAELELKCLPLFHGAVTYKTALLREIDYRQMEGCLYTDLQWTSIPMAYIRNVVYFDYPVYMYRLGREGQSVAPEVRVRFLRDEFSVRSQVLKTFAHANFVSSDNRRLCKIIARKLASRMYREALVKKEIPIDMLKPFDESLRSDCPLTYSQMNREMVSDAILVPYVWLWRHGHNRMLNAAVSFRNLFHKKKK